MSPALNDKLEDGEENVEHSQKSQKSQKSKPEVSAASQDQTVSQPPRLPPPKRATTAPTTSTHASPIASPGQSRETSPTRPSQTKAVQNVAKQGRSRRNSQDISPHRAPNSTGPSLPEQPSAAAVQRALSVAPRLPSPAKQEQATEPVKSQRNPRSSAASSQNSANTSSSRIRSPPGSTPSRQVSATQRKNDKEHSSPSTPKIVVDDTGKSSQNIDTIAEEDDSEEEMPSGMKSPPKSKGSSGILEVVHESSLPESPAILTGLDLQNGHSKNSRSSANESKPKDPPTTNSAPTESGSESGGSKTPAGVRKESGNVQKPQASSRPPSLRPNNSFTQLSNSKNKSTADGSARNMTVETETVTSVPNVGVGVAQRDASGRAEGQSTVRLKPSSETIRPKKDKKKVPRKTPSVQSGTASSKADIFEAKVASAVDEADSSDSAETFVYESNPPEPYIRPNRYHSRTPSAASTASQVDPYGGRFRPDGHNSIVGKKSMKFANNSHSIAGHQGDADNASHTGTIGSGRGTAPNGSHHHHHIGRHGRTAGHASIFDNDSPFANAKQQPIGTKHGRISSRPNSPRSPFGPRVPGSAKSTKSVYNLEDEVADDERTPLIPARNSRTRHSRRPMSRHDEPLHIFKPRGIFGSVMCWLGFGLLATVLIAVITVALVLCSKTISSVRVDEIRNVIASEEEIVFDLHVRAMNPNIIPIQVDQVDIKVFARSKYVVPSRNDYLDVGPHTTHEENSKDVDLTKHWGSGGIDEGTDPIEDPEGGDLLLLGRIAMLDSPIKFDASPIAHRIFSDTGEASISKPANLTADDGTNRWKIVVKHPFELIVVGQLRYGLPLSTKEHRVSFPQVKKTVDPDQPSSGKDLDCILSESGCKEGKLELAFKA